MKKIIALRLIGVGIGLIIIFGAYTAKAIYIPPSLHHPYTPTVLPTISTDPVPTNTSSPTDPVPTNTSSPTDPSALPDGTMSVCQKQQYWFKRSYDLISEYDALQAIYYQKECKS